MLGLVGCAQIGRSPGSTAPTPETTSQAAPTTTENSTTTTTAPFVYRVGVLAGLTAPNFWAFQGEDFTVWNAYILGPTKPSLFSPHPESSALGVEAALGFAEPELRDGVWRVRVELNPEMEWSDGVPITATDLAFTFEAVRGLDLGGAWQEAYPPVVAEVTAIDDHTVEISFAERPSLSVWPHGVGTAPIMPAHVWESTVGSVSEAAQLYAVAGVEDVSGGPLQVVEAIADLVRSRANPGYAHQVGPDLVEYHVFSNEAEAVQALNQGSIDTILTPNGLNPMQLEMVAADAPVEVIESRTHGIRYIGFNLEREPMSSPQFRKALALIHQRELNTFTTEASLLWYDSVKAAAIAEPYQAPLAERVGIALEGLREAGYSWEVEPHLDGETMASGQGLTIGGVAPQTLTILTPGDAWDPARPVHAAEIAATLEFLGFTVVPVETDFDTVVELAFTPSPEGVRQYDMYLLGWTLGRGDLPSYHRMLFAPDGAMNNTGYNSERFAVELGRYESAFSTDSARESLWALESILAEDLPYLLLYPATIVEVFRSDRVRFDHHGSLGGLQGRLGGIGDVSESENPG